MTSRNRVCYESTLCRIALLLVAWAAVFDNSPARAEGSGDSLWRGLREQFPFHLQTVGLSEPNAQGERILIIAEPPSTLPRSSFREALRSIFGEALREAHSMRQPIGYDGWAEDIVATLRYSIDNAGGSRLLDDITLLGERLYGTAYKFTPIRLPAKRRAGPTAPPSLAVSAAELKVWLLDNDAPLTAVDIGTQHRLKDLLAGGRPGAYLSPQRGLVVLILPRDFPIDAYRGEIRKFALDSDAIVGALAIGKRRLAVIGRERDTPLDAVPPLRVESILALAATKEKELGQSYERRDAFAGELIDGPDVGKDWAPIYLSRDLVNTEMGSLLNITDQMLKSWSESGKVEYVHFPYPKPTSFPFAGGLLRALGAPGVTFNWNTVGVGSVFAFQEAQVFALTRTGSLPVSYFPEGSAKDDPAVQKAMSAEDRGYDYFSALRDPFLGRVVQYSAMYQVFRSFPVQVESDESPPGNYRAATEFALAKTREALRAIAKGEAAPDPIFLNHAIEVLAREEGKQLSEVEKKAIAATLRARFCANPAAAFNKLEKETGQNIAERMAVRLADRGSISSKGRLERLLAKADAMPDVDLRDLIKSLTPKYREVAIDLVLEENAAEMAEELRRCLGAMADIDSVKARYVAAAKPIESGYIKTPSIVLSSYPGFTGGHNLYSRTTTVELTATTPKGRVIIETGPQGDKILRLNPEDAQRSNELVRAFERHADEPNVQALVEAQLARGGVVREMKVALQLNQISATESRGLTRALEGDTIIGETGVRSLPNNADVLRVAQQAEARGLDLIVTREGEGFLVLRVQPKPTRAVRAPTEPGIMEVISAFAEDTAAMRLPSGLPPLRFGAGTGIDQGELWGIIRTQQLRTAAGGGGGWGKPPHIRSLTGDIPESGRPRGWFLHGDGDGDKAIAYGRRGDSDEIIVLQAVAKDSIKAKEALGKSVDWGKADIKHVGSSAIGSEIQLSYEISIPIKSTGWFGFAQSSLVVRVIGYFKRLLNPDEVREVEATLREVVARSASRDSIAADGIADLKAEILRKVKPERLEFHLDHGAGDLIVVERRRESSCDFAG